MKLIAFTTPVDPTEPAFGRILQDRDARWARCWIGSDLPPGRCATLGSAGIDGGRA